MSDCCAAVQMSEPTQCYLSHRLISVIYIQKAHSTWSCALLNNLFEVSRGRCKPVQHITGTLTIRTFAAAVPRMSEIKLLFELLTHQAKHSAPEIIACTAMYRRAAPRFASQAVHVVDRAGSRNETGDTLVGYT
jgi:hypothetical protein